MLCGQFLPAQERGKAEWTPFATIKTSGYEQWVGARAAGLCQQSSIIWDEQGDLSSTLQSRLDSSVRNGNSSSAPPCSSPPHQRICGAVANDRLASAQRTGRSARRRFVAT